MISTEQLVLAIGGLCTVIAFLFRAYDGLWRARFVDMQQALSHCQGLGLQATGQTSRVTDMAVRQQTVAAAQAVEIVEAKRGV